MKTIHSNRVDLNLLEVFEAVASTGSTTLAGERLAISQSAVSHALNRLRDIIGDPLFVRGHGALVPTPLALDIVAPVQILLQDARALMVPRRFDPPTSTRCFQVGASDYAAATMVPALVRRVRAKAPNAIVAVQPVDEQVLPALETGALDIAFIGAPPPVAPYRSCTLFEEHFIGVLCARHPLALKAGQGRLTLDDYLAYPHAMVTFRDPHLSPIDAALAKLGRSRHIALVTPNFASTVLSLIGTDLLMSIPARLAADISEALIRFTLPLPVANFPYSLIWHQRTATDPACSWLRSEVTATLA